MTLIDKDAVNAAIKGCFGDTVYQVMEQGTFIRKATDAINALPETCIVKVDMEDEKPLDVGKYGGCSTEAINNAFKPNSEFSLQRKPLSETIQGVINERNEIIAQQQESFSKLLASHARLTSRLALAERVMRNLAKVLCSPRYDRGDGCGDEEQLLARYGWTKEDINASGD